MIHLRTIPVSLTVALLLTSCGGRDDDADADTTAGAAADATIETVVEDDDDQPEETAPPTDPADDGGDDAGDSPTGSVSERCGTLFSEAEASELFGEPGVYDTEMSSEETTLGQLVCSWATVEDPDDPDDLDSQSLLVQIYSGDPIPGENFYDPSFFDDATEIDGIGDAAYVDGTGTEAGFLDGQRAGFISFFAFNFGSGDESPVTEEQVVEILRVVHERSG